MGESMVVSVQELRTMAANRAADAFPGEAGARASSFVQQLYAELAGADLATRSADDSYGAALALWRLAEQRQPGQPIVRVYNPDFEQSGWQSTHTVVEIVTDDIPFLVDSVRMALNAQGLTIHLVVHPVLRLIRTPTGEVARLDARTEQRADASCEAVMQVEVDRIVDVARLDLLADTIRAALADVSAVVADWQPMRCQLESIIAGLGDLRSSLDAQERARAREFLEWVRDDHFTFVGYREYEFDRAVEPVTLRWGPQAGLGIHRYTLVGSESVSFAKLPQAMRDDAMNREILVVAKANVRATVHRPGYLDYIGVRCFDEQGNVIGEQRFLGLFTAPAYNLSATQIPRIRDKVAKVRAGAGYPPNSHAGKALLYILESYPRDLLFQVDETALANAAMEVLQLQERQRVRLIMHADRFRRFVSCIVYVPRDRFNTERRLAMQRILEESLGGTAEDFTVQLSASVLARLYFVIRVDNNTIPTVDRDDVEQRLRAVLVDWNDGLSETLLARFGESRGVTLRRRYAGAFRAHYRDNYTPRMAARDIEHMEDLVSDAAGNGAITMALFRPPEAAPGLLRFKLFRSRCSVHLSDALPMLENMGLRVTQEWPSTIRRGAGDDVWLHDFELQHDLGANLLFDRALRDAFEHAFAEIWNQHVESDGFNQLVLRARLHSRQIVVLRAYCKYLRQIGTTYSQSYMQQTLAQHPSLAAELVKLFEARFDVSATPAARSECCTRHRTVIVDALEQVASLDEDRMLRAFLGAIDATIRTNYCVDISHDASSEVDTDGLVLKFDCAALADLPEPRPLYEIFVYSPRFEGIHLRGDKVARGGLRWSDRPEDFRTEVLGLVKAQMVKNAVIVPMGSKGGFVPKRAPLEAGRDAILADGIRCYRAFIAGLLSVTDNLEDGAVVPPAQVARYDDDDPYLVVAADKGTATFSDEANSIAEKAGYWLGDAFASGGSEGYDHKRMGITARGAWESVKRHFRELGLNTQAEPFTVAGVGDMGGDVFGNGMLLSSQIQLVAAFNHMHIFLDPNPELEASFAQRERLFALPRSSWSDYDDSVISSGGGVFSRASKSLDVSSQAAAVLGIEAGAYPPNAVIAAILRAPVELFWNGGIGTYVRADHESDAQVGDRANDAVRINALELRCRVVGEGGNLGLTQAARVQFARAGGRINTDAIDNSAGVDCSDHEVNIKVLLGAVVANGDMTRKQRNVLLAQMTEEVGELVLANNYQQTQTLALACAQSVSMLDVHERLMRALERDANLDRAIEFLPDELTLQERRAAGAGLCAPELAVLMAYTKIDLYRALMRSSLPDSSNARRALHAYFPQPLRDNFAEAITTHRLGREIAATQIANEVVNRAGATFVMRLSQESGAEVADVTQMFLVAWEVFDMGPFWRSVEALDTQVAAATQTQLLLRGRRLVERATRWFLRGSDRVQDTAALVSRYAPNASQLGQELFDWVAPSTLEHLQTQMQEWLERGVPEPLAARAARLDEVLAALDLTHVAERADVSLQQAAAAYFNVAERIDLGWLREQIVHLPRETHWQSLARAALRDDLFAAHSELASAVLAGVAGRACDELDAVETWVLANAQSIRRCAAVIADASGNSNPDLAMLSVAMRELRGLSCTVAQ